MKRSERIAVITKILTDSPNKIYTLNSFAEMFGSAKSTISEDLVIIKDAFAEYGHGHLVTVTGAAGGVKYMPNPSKQSSQQFIRLLSAKLNDSERALTGGSFYMSDILADPSVVRQMGDILAAKFMDKQPDFVLTIETRGIPVALMTAASLGVPLVIARRANPDYEGTLVTITYISGSGSREPLSLAKRSVKEGQKALIIDDFMHCGGSAKGLIDLMREFSISVVGVGVVLAAVNPSKKMVDDYVELMKVTELSDGTSRVEPASWLI